MPLKSFFQCKDEKITEKAFSQCFFISILSIVLCIVALCSTTFAWFNSATASNNNKLVSGSFDISVSVTKVSEADGTLIENGTAIPVSDDGSYKLGTPGTYTVKVIPKDGSTVKGYCIVTVDSGRVYKTDAVFDGKSADDGNAEAPAPFLFTVIAEKSDTVLTLESHWGVLAKPDVKNGAIITVKESLVEIENTDASK